MTNKERKVIETVWDHYRRHGRRSLPWRLTADPYRILVSEIMLQQTQVDRVVPKYHSFLKRFPTVRALAKASLGEVLREWQGLGYNRRAKMLHACAEHIVTERKGTFPETYEELRTLPGVGPYTAGAVMAFAFNKGVPMIETNIRTVILHHFFNGKTKVSDREIIRLIERMLNGNPREWYAALMDYGSYLKKIHGNPNIRSKHYVRQPAFKNSDRHIRGAILKLLTEKQATAAMLYKKLSFDFERVSVQLAQLTNEGMILKTGRTYGLP